jgi:hypothetical protein
MSEKIVRIDLYSIPATGVTRVMKFAEGWTASTPPSQNYESEKSLEEIVAWLEANGWIVRKWYNGARAFKNGTMAPIRCKFEIIAKRQSLQKWPDPHLQIHALDLAYDL